VALFLDGWERWHVLISHGPDVARTAYWSPVLLLNARLQSRVQPLGAVKRNPPRPLKILPDDRARISS
jgi:hypothetical protein